MKSSIAFILLSVALLFALPFLLSQGLTNVAIQMLIAALFACAYNLLCGQAGMLSFGHAAYFGVGAFATVHAMNAIGGTGLLPVPLLPLVGAASGLAIGAFAGWFVTKRSGTYFAMITLAIAELFHSLAPHLAGLFGGEAGISAMRAPAWGLDFGSTTQVYYLTLTWVLISLALLYLYTLTPAGRLTLGLRENSHRLRFLGYNVHGLGVLVFAISAMFSGIAGGLQVLSNEAANYAVFDPSLSAAVVINTFIGGVKLFLGPALGAVLMTFFSYAASDLTQSWLLYQGVLFVLIMMFMPTGLAGLFGASSKLRRDFGIAPLLPVALLSLCSALLLSAGGVFIVEMVQRTLSRDYRAMVDLHAVVPWPPIALFGRAWLPDSAITWLTPFTLLAIGSVLACLMRRRMRSLEKGKAEPLATQTSPASMERSIA